MLLLIQSFRSICLRKSRYQTSYPSAIFSLASCAHWEGSIWTTSSAARKTRGTKPLKGKAIRIPSLSLKHGFRNCRSTPNTHVNHSNLYNLGKSGTSIFLLKESAKVQRQHKPRVPDHLTKRLYAERAQHEESKQNYAQQDKRLNTGNGSFKQVSSHKKDDKMEISKAWLSAHCFIY